VVVEVTAPMQNGLWGRPAPTSAPSTGRSEINDVELVASVVRAAMSRGYVLVGPAARLYLREPGGPTTGGRVEPVPAYEQDTVRQLLGSGHLTTGGVHQVSYGRRDGPRERGAGTESHPGHGHPMGRPAPADRPHHPHQ
jgi:hypothetical protein